MSNYSAQFKPSINVKSSKSQQVQDPTKFPTSLEVPTIFSQGNNNFSAIPEEVKASVSLLHSLPSDTLANIIQNMLDHLLSIEDFHADSIDIDFINLQRKQLKLGELKDQFSVIYTALYQIIRTTVRNKINLSTLRSSLQLFNYPSPVSEKLVNHVMLLRSKAYSLQKFNQSFQCKWPTVAKLRWRIDVVISSGSLSRVMRPNIIMQVYHFNLCLNF